MSFISIEVENVKKAFGSTEALKGVTVNFKPGPMHGVIGPEGAGKTTLIRIILGLLKPNEGNVRYWMNANEVSFEAVRSSIAYMPQQQSLYPDLSIDEHLYFFKELYGIRDLDYTKKREELLHITRLKEFVTRPAGKLSGGMYKKLGLMCALLRSPQVILLDEPTNGVDPISRREFWELLYRLSDQKILIILTTAYMDEAERCGEVHLIEKGKIIEEGNPRELLESEKVESFDQFFLQRGADESS